MIITKKRIIPKRDEILEYRNKQYVGSNTVVIVAGNINEKKALSEIEKAFKRMPKGKPEDKLAVVEKQDEPLVNIKYKDSDQTHFILGTRGYDMFNDDKYILNLLGVMFGGNMSSRLFMEIREKLGLAY